MMMTMLVMMLMMVMTIVEDDNVQGKYWALVGLLDWTVGPWWYWRYDFDFDDEDAYDGTEGWFLKLEVGPSTDSNKGGLRSQIWMIFWKTQESQSQMWKPCSTKHWQPGCPRFRCSWWWQWWWWRWAKFDDICEKMMMMQLSFKLDHHSDAEFRFMPPTVIPSD